MCISREEGWKWFVAGLEEASASFNVSHGHPCSNGCEAKYRI